VGLDAVAPAPSPAAGPSAEPTPEPTAEVDRALTAKMQTEVPIGVEVPLLVTITLDVTAAPSPTSRLRAKPGDRIDVVVQTSGSLDVVGTGGEAFVIDSSPEQMRRFAVRGRSAGDATVDVFAFHDGACVAKASITARVVAGAADPAQSEVRADIQATEQAADLSLFIFEQKESKTYSVLATSADAALGYNLAPLGTVKLDDSVEKFFSAFFQEIENILTASGSAEQKLDQLKARGDYLTKIIVPAPLHEALWNLRDRIKVIQIQSAEPWIPWELCRLSGGAPVTDAGFLSEKFVVTRWLMGVAQQPKLTARNIGVVLPSGTGLTAAEPERAFLHTLASPSRKVEDIPADATALRRALALGTYDGFHFTGHGQYSAQDADRSAVLMEPGSPPFTPEDVSGVVANLGLARPLVFLNACEIGRAGSVLGGLAGWPPAFIQAGAGAFVGPYWKIGDGAAEQFVRTFYRELLERGATVGEAAHRARLAVRDATDPTWLSYVVYAHPNARVDH